MKKHLTLLAGTLLPATSFAHPGHDHGHWSSAFVHGALFVGLVALVALGVKLSQRRKAAIKEEI